MYATLYSAIVYCVMIPNVLTVAPHVSFPYGRLEDNKPRRESVEVRTFVFYE
jgi:hypothetical protein